MSSDRDRLDAAIAGLDAPRQHLAAALAALRGVVGVLVTGAHPDDEMSAMIAALARRDGVHVAYACATRGEGGQNAIGRESGALLGALRTREMALAARRLGMAVHWLSDAAGDTIVDFGFAKTAEASFARWGRERLVERLVAVIRAEKPDIVWPTFLDVPGQHGHHRAVTQATIEAVRRAADPACTTGGEPWQVAKLYLPAWSGGGGTYDDALPPPNASVVYDAGGIDADSGLTYVQLGECSRAAHASQGMGHWVEVDVARYPLHRLDRGVEEASIFDGLPRRLGDLAAGLDEETGEALRAAQAALDRATDAASAQDDIAAALDEADACIEMALQHLAPRDRAAFGHRLERKRAQIAAAGIALAGGPAPADPAPPPDSGISLRTEPECLLLNRATAAFEAVVQVKIESGGGSVAGHVVTLDMPPGWQVAALAAGPDPDSAALRRFRVVAPRDAATARHDLGLSIDGAAGSTVRRSVHDHVGAIAIVEPAVLPVCVLDAALPAATRVAYVGGGGDRVDLWLSRLGLDVTALDPAAFAACDLARFTTLVVGIFALRTRPDLAAALPRVHDWVRAGGHLVTLYHRPVDGWDEHRSAPAPLAIGTPSLRWRVCDPDAPVKVLQPDHALLATPNRIAAADWLHWRKERGLYFAARWDAAYQPLLAMHDPGEAPLTGALLSGRFGRGRHTHTSLVLHHQLEQLVPGAFRLMANLVQPA